MNLYGYVRTSRRARPDAPGMNPETQERLLLADGVPSAGIYRDVAVSGAAAPTSRPGWSALDAAFDRHDILVVAAIDRIGRDYLDVVTTLMDLRKRGVRIRSLSDSERDWTKYLEAPNGGAEAFIGDIVLLVVAWCAEKELQEISRRTKAGLARARATGTKLGRPPALDDEAVSVARALRSRKWGYRRIGQALGVSRNTVRKHLREDGGNHE